ncbi:hypothetical protein AAII07_27460 [Microvirga sp. 0TCS3.31]
MASLRERASLNWMVGKDEDEAVQDCVGLQEEAWLLGQPGLNSFLDHMTETVVGDVAPSRAALVDEWRKANDHYYDLEIKEAGIADQVEILDLPPVLAPHSAEIMADSSYQRAFDVLPTRFAMVQLERLVSSQRHVNLSHVRRLRSRLSPSPALEELFRFCFPLERSELKVRMRPSGRNRFTICSESSDFRFHEAVMFQPEQIMGYAAKGAVGGIIGLVVGFGSNFVCGVQSDSRVLLHNGHHRAYALLEHGITHAPCIIETVTRKEELSLVARSRVLEAAAFYFKAARPPLLKDFLDPRTRKVVTVPRQVHMIDVSFEVQDYTADG